MFQVKLFFFWKGLFGQVKVDKSQLGLTERIMRTLIRPSFAPHMTPVLLRTLGFE